ncbi:MULTISPECIES: TnsA endonuclease N-terminal domain-containing protein [unclassified Marinobacter]|uniref:TnsA endonuclease N-terminal domain-containing protein n=1 Tax=unclassified Marinobacter TaxID=83889 RepID=UPI000BF29C62|nr:MULTISPECIES: TnsA endonuclease N-terminal domain-containing protein [unclassified Marinobacter]PFG10625.1 TnsA endonuclease-like protein [Marinobacter sp. LV10MA510-1]PFG52544.1 TnsA endonuclease-like protein [Marinobacter sp. LV10R520-4]
MADTNKPIDPKHERLLKTRGRGAGKDYEPFIKVHELSSQGESVRIRSASVGRVHHLLSGIELYAFLIFDQFEKTIDIREQYPLPIEDTLDICARLGIRHPQVRGLLTVVSTDLLIDLSSGKQLAIAVKPSSELSKLRVMEKLQIEKTFWEAHGIEWRIFTQREVTDGMRENLLWIQPYLNPDMTNHQELGVSDVQDLLYRLELYPQAKVTRLCAKLDDQYELDPGFHLSILRHAVAYRFIRAPLDKAFYSWTYGDLALRETVPVAGVNNAS